MVLTVAESSKRYRDNSPEKYRASQEKYRPQKNIQSRLRKQGRRKLLEEIKVKSGCVDCGNDEPSVLDFDHRDPTTKKFSISNSVGRIWEDLLAEVAKCDVRCANCHRKRTAVLKHHSTRRPTATPKDSVEPRA